ncbi:MAG: hypothetical protein K0Q82_2925 [Chryseobacterium indoltheticum]|jgi:hypothetical protein|nr:hypothetical protein [Chryseobacterium indoltheticum]
MFLNIGKSDGLEIADIEFVLNGKTALRIGRFSYLLIRE